MKAVKTTKIVYHVYVKVKGRWFDKAFPAKDCGCNEATYPDAMTLTEAKKLVGSTGNLWKITTVAEPIIQNED